MKKDGAYQFKDAIDSKLKAEGVDKSQMWLCIKTLKECVLGTKLAEAYMIIYGAENDTTDPKTKERQIKS